jgi:hypothetical protein
MDKNQLFSRIGELIKKKIGGSQTAQPAAATEQSAPVSMAPVVSEVTQQNAGEVQQSLLSGSDGDRPESRPRERERRNEGGRYGGKGRDGPSRYMRRDREGGGRGGDRFGRRNRFGDRGRRRMRPDFI